MRIQVDLAAIEANARTLRRRLDADLVGVVKGVGADRRVAETLVEAGVGTLGVSRVGHLRALQDLDASLQLLRIPAPSDLDAVVNLADVTLHGSRTVLERAADVSAREGVVHRVVPMVDAGDGREGMPVAEARVAVDWIRDRDALALEAVGLTLGCFGDRPDPEAVRRVAARFPDVPLSVGGSGLLLARDALASSVASYRIGDALLTGKWESTPVPGLRQGAIRLEAEVLASRAESAVVDVGRAVTDPRHLLPVGDFGIERWSNEQAVISTAVPEGEFVSFEMEYDAVATTFNARPDAVEVAADSTRRRVCNPDR